MAEQTAKTVKINVEVEYTFDHTLPNTMNACGLEIENSPAFKKLFERIQNNEFEGKKRSEIVEMILTDLDIELAKIFIVMGIMDYLESVQQFNAMQVIHNMASSLGLSPEELDKIMSESGDDIAKA